MDAIAASLQGLTRASSAFDRHAGDVVRAVSRTPPVADAPAGLPAPPAPQALLSTTALTSQSGAIPLRSDQPLQGMVGMMMAKHAYAASAAALRSASDLQARTLDLLG